MKPNTLIFLILFISYGQSAMAQDIYAEVLSEYNDGSVPYISVSQLVGTSDNVTLLDAREKEEFEVSHLQDAIYVGFKDFDIDAVTRQLKDHSQTIVVYCSIGVRSETIAEQLKTKGYLNVFNLYGGIFEWFNQEQPVYNEQHQVTDSIHAYSKRWGIYLKRGIKIYE